MESVPFKIYITDLIEIYGYISVRSSHTSTRISEYMQFLRNDSLTQMILKGKCSFSRVTRDLDLSVWGVFGVTHCARYEQQKTIYKKLRQESEHRKQIKNTNQNNINILKHTRPFLCRFFFFCCSAVWYVVVVVVCVMLLLLHGFLVCVRSREVR